MELVCVDIIFLDLLGVRVTEGIYVLIVESAMFIFSLNLGQITSFFSLMTMSNFRLPRLILQNFLRLKIISLSHSRCLLLLQLHLQLRILIHLSLHLFLLFSGAKMGDSPEIMDFLRSSVLSFTYVKFIQLVFINLRHLL